MKKIEYFLVKRLFPIVLIILGVSLIGNHNLGFLKNLNFVENVVIHQLGGSFIVILGGLFFSNETSLKEIYKFLAFISLLVFLYFGWNFAKYLYNLEGIGILKSFLLYAFFGSLSFIFFYLAEEENPTTET